MHVGHSADRSPRQRWLDLNGPDQHFQLLHGRHAANVAVCSRDRTDWQERVYAHDDAGAMAAQLVAGNGDLDVYQSQSAFRNLRRLNDAAVALPGLFVDLDHYKVPALAALDPEALLDRVLEASPWLPAPTLLIGSGRGVYFSWLFPTPLGRDQLARWQLVESTLVAILEPFGADQQAKDAARVLRIVGSINQRSGVVVSGVHNSGRAVAFATLERVILQNGLPAQQKETSQRATLSTCATAAQRAQHLSAYALADARMRDCRRIAELRGLPLADCRARLLFVFAVAAVWFTSNEDQLVAELQGFAGELFADGDSYGPAQVGTVIDRMRKDRAGIVVPIWQGRRVPNRYRMRNSTIVQILELTADEQRELRTIIGRDERQRRRQERRRAAGMVDRAAQAAERYEQAVNLHLGGWKQDAIAAEIGIRQGQVSKLLARWRSNYS